MNKFERFMVTACPWLFGSACILVGLLVAGSDKRLDARMTWVVMICSGFILFTLHGVNTILLQILKALEGQKNKREEG